jgi:superfamily II DNA or RNA helicase
MSLFPDLNDEDISDKLKKVPEVVKLYLKNHPDLEPHQRFVKTFLSKYDNLLLFHGLGTGKTCSSVFCSESFLEKQNNIYVICPLSLKDQFRNTLFEPDSIVKKGKTFELDQRCKLQTFVNICETSTSSSDIVDKINYLIDRYYSFFSYDEFSDFIANAASSSSSPLDQVRRLKFLFDRSLIIIDECHHVSEHASLKKGLQMLNKCDHKLLMMSATPIYKSVDEIIWIVNLLNSRNLHREKLTESNFEGLFKENINGIVSFVEGEDPTTFPLKIFPSSGQPSKFEDILYKSEMSPLQQKKKANSNIYYPQNSLDTIMVKHKKKKQSTVYKLCNESSASFFKNIEVYSGKFAAIRDIILDSEGIILLYSKFIENGIVPLACMLEANGVNRYKHPNMLIESSSSSSSYIVLCGDKDITDPAEVEEQVNLVNDEDNSEGQNIKYILMDETYCEGTDLKCVRQTHVVEPCSVYTQLQQIIGRGCRNYSHYRLPKSKRNIQIFLHSCSPEEESMYKKLYADYSPISQILDIMKEESVDLKLNLTEKRKENKNEKTNVKINLSFNKSFYL